MTIKRNPPIRQRPIQVKFFVDEKELDLIKQKMAQMGTDNMSAYIRKMVIDGYVVNLDMPELRELTSKMKRISNSENQIAKQLNTTGNIYEADIEEIKKNQEEIYEGIKKILLSLSKLYYSTTKYFEKRQDFFTCSTHRANKDKCSGHYIRAVVLEDLVWNHMKEVISYVTRYEAHFRVEMEQKLRLQSEETIRVYKKRLAQAEKRIGELDRLFIKIYEDNAKGKLNDDRFAMMSKTYEDEQAQLKVEIVNLQKEIEVQERQIEDLEQFIQRARRYTDITELTPYALRELVKAVYVEAPDKSSGKRKQRVHIEYDLVGYIPVDELIKAKQA